MTEKIHTLINHEREPHCCGCWIIEAGYDLVASCNECGEVRDLSQVLAPRAPDLSAKTLEGLLVAIARAEDARGLKIHLRPAMVLKGEIVAMLPEGLR
jgi:hypothetical protein